MEQQSSYISPISTLPLRFIGGVILALLGALGIFYMLMQPPMNEVRLMALFLTVTAVISIVSGYGAYRLGWIRHSPHISWTLLGSYALSSFLTFLNVWVTARLMFASQHDLLLATVLLLFASGIAMSLGYFISVALTAHLTALNHAAQHISEGNLRARVVVSGRDEVAVLGRTFNEMAAQLEEMARKQEELDQMRRDLVAWVGHDLRTPLASIRAIVEALADGVVEEPATVQRYLRTAKRDVQSLSLLIDDLFELAQLDAGGLALEKQPNSLADLISDTIESFSTIAQERGVRLEGVVTSDVDPVPLDAQKIARVLSNLVENSLRHTPAGGAVTVSASRNAEGVQVEIGDTGEGIPADDLPFIFDQFFRGERSRSRATGGSGLGLAIAKRMVEAHGGWIAAESDPGTRTRITFMLPKNEMGMRTPA